MKNVEQFPDKTMSSWTAIIMISSSHLKANRNEIISTEMKSIIFRATHPWDTLQRQVWRHQSQFLPQMEASERLSVIMVRCPGMLVTRWRSSMENTRPVALRTATILTTDRACLITNTQVCLQWILMMTRPSDKKSNEHLGRNEWLTQNHSTIWYRWKYWYWAEKDCVSADDSGH